MMPNAQSIALHVVDDDHARSEVLTWDGRLDNRQDLLMRLADSVRGDTSDQGVVLAAYQRWGHRGLAEIIGDWSVVIRDSGSRAIVLASDYAGVRPLYYHWQTARLDWSANLEAVVEAAGTPELDEQYVAGFLTFGGCPNRTPYAGIRSVPPGHAVRVTAKGMTIHPFWAAPTVDTIRYRDERRYDEQLRGLFREAVAVRLQTSAPVLAELSGGFDSSSVVCMASQLIRSAAVAAPSLTTISYVHRDSLDLPFIDEIETFCGIDGVHLSTHEDRLISETEVGNAMPECWAPVHRSVANVAERLGAKALLTGQNGDLVMGNWFDDSLQVAAALRRGHLRRAFDEALAWSKVLRIPLGRILWRAAQASLPRSWTSHALYTLDGGVSGPKSVETSLLPGFRARTGVDEPHGIFSGDWMDAPPERRKHFQALTSMRELRALQLLEPVQGFHYTHPFAHRPLVEFMMSIPANVLCGPGQPRKLMRRALADLWPPKLRARRSKSLFGAPWIEALRPLALSLIKSPQWQVVERGWVDRASLAVRLDKVTKGLDCNEPQLRQIIMLEWWLRKRGQGRRSEALLQAS
jgi:asparagine synthase (glutamine-hydrolysing)